MYFLFLSFPFFSFSSFLFVSPLESTVYHRGFERGAAAREVII